MARPNIRFSISRRVPFEFESGPSIAIERTSSSVVIGFDPSGIAEQVPQPDDTDWRVLAVNDNGETLGLIPIPAIALQDGDKGDLTVSGDGTAWSLNSEVIGNDNVSPSAAIAGTKLANTPAGNIVATTVQAAINELDTEKLAKAGGTVTGDVVFDQSRIQIEDASAEPAEYGSTGSSIGEGPIHIEYTRSGGYPSYGNVIVTGVVTAATGAGLFDVNVTHWMNHRNLTGGQCFGFWVGNNSPSQEHGDTWSSGGGAAVEINGGNRWGDFGLQDDIGTGRWWSLEQIVPDVTPDPGRSPPAGIYPASFGRVYSASVHGHKMWTVELVRTDTIPAGGRNRMWNGGSTSMLAPGSMVKAAGYWDVGIDLSSATFSGAIIVPGSNQDIGTTSARVRKGYFGGLTIFDGAGTVAGDSTLYVTNNNGAVLRIGYNGTAVNYISGSDTYFRNAGETQDLMRLQASTGNLTPEYAAGTRSLGTVSKPWGPLYADSATLGAPLPIASGGTGQTTAAEAIGEMTQALTQDTTPDALAGLIPFYDPTSDTGMSATFIDMLDALGMFRPLWVLNSANMNSTADQAFTKIGTFSGWMIQQIFCWGPSTSLTTAAGGIYPTTAKGGTAIVAAATAYSTLSATNKSQVLTIANRDTDITAPYLSLTTAQGSAATLNFVIVGRKLS